MYDPSRMKFMRGGAYGVFYGFDEAVGENVVLIVERGESDRGTPREGFGVPGGIVDIETETEQPAEACVRELHEEVLDDESNPVLPDVTPDRLELVDTDINYKANRHHDLQVATANFGYACELEQEEIDLLRAYIERLQNEPDFAKAYEENTNFEMKTVLLLEPSDFLNRIEGGMKFAYDHEKNTAVKIAKRLIDGKNRKAA